MHSNYGSTLCAAAARGDVEKLQVGWSVGRIVISVGRLVGWSVGRLVGWSVGRSVGR
jgi:hypothetical protein